MVNVILVKLWNGLKEYTTIKPLMQEVPAPLKEIMISKMKLYREEALLK